MSALLANFLSRHLFSWNFQKQCTGMSNFESAEIKPCEYLKKSHDQDIERFYQVQQCHLVETLLQ